MVDIDTTIVNDLVELGQFKANEISNGLLNDFTTASPLTAILEAVAIVAAVAIGEANNVANTLERDRLEALGVTRNSGTKALATAIVTLDALYNSPFFLGSGFRISFGGIEFETIGDLNIAAYQATGEVSIVSLAIGVRGNVPVKAIASYSPVAGVASITLREAASGGTEPETEEEWRNRIYGTLRRRDTLISEDDFEAEVIGYLGQGSTALAIGRLKPDYQSYANGYVAVFGLNADGSELNSAQLSELGDYLSRKAAMAAISLDSLNLFDLSISIAANFLPGTDPSGLAAIIEEAIASYLKPGNLKPGEAILNKAIEYEVQQLEGIIQGLVHVKINGLAQPQALPYKWSVAKLVAASITLISANNQTFEFDYTY
ncbi:MAG: hypothetical protein F6K14_30905 [Symploca sp. SIO2C1]|nr:hypothetical protein [Symploca sp. SIO2C1]